MTVHQDDERQLEIDFSIIDPKMTVQAMRDSGYKSTTHALAELIDNSIESGAEVIEVFGLSRRDDRTNRHRLQELAVLDNGRGMDASTLRGALRFGYGTRRDRRGIGRFGMGLPNSSMSQARRLDVWSWQSGVPNALHTCLHLDDVERGATNIPEPSLRAVPPAYLKASRVQPGDCGTLVLWSDLDRVEWRRVSSVFRHTENFLGRIYRRFLAKESERLHETDERNEEIGPQRSIFLIPVDDSAGEIKVEENEIVEVRPNDPLYLMTGTSCPEHFGPGPMFQELPDFSPLKVPVKFNGHVYEVRLRASYVRPYARDQSLPSARWPEQWKGSESGSTPWGKHAAQNMGVSLVRAHREIQLDDSWVSHDDPRERWWKVEVDFPTALDEVFGVTNNKQGTVNFQRLSAFDYRRDALEGEQSPRDVRKRMKEDSDPRFLLLDIHEQIRRCITVMRPKVRAAKKVRGTSTQAPSDEAEANAKATAAIKRRQQGGHRGASDEAAEKGTEEQHKEQQIQSLTQKHHLDPDDALHRVDETIRSGSRVRWIQSAQQSPAFFDVEPLPNVVQVVFNTDHPVHSHLWEVMHPTIGEDVTSEELEERLARAAMAFRILIYSWARFEEEQQAERVKREVRNARIEWGKYAEDFFDEDDDSPQPTDLI